jgi:hypothetical protein
MNGVAVWVEIGTGKFYESLVRGADVLNHKISFEFEQFGSDYQVILERVPNSSLWKTVFSKDGQVGHAEARVYRGEDGRVAIIGQRWLEKYEGVTHEYRWFLELS